jgi:iron complex transport system substrate-binding protein
VKRREFLALAVLAACKKASPISSENSDAEKKASRVVSLSPSTTETVCAIGGRDLLVGRSRYCDYPPDVASLPEVGGYVDPNIEAILALRPDLVVGARGPSGSTITDALAAHGIATYFPRTESLAEIDAMIAGIGERTGHAKEASDVVAKMHADEEAVAKGLEGKPEPRVLFVFGVSPIVCAGPGTFADEMLKRAHARNAVTEGSGYPTMGIERVLAIDPDVIIEAAWGEQGAQAIAKGMAGWGRLRAVKDDRVDHLGDETVLRPGPRVVRGIETLARAIHR